MRYYRLRPYLYRLYEEQTVRIRNEKLSEALKLLPVPVKHPFFKIDSVNVSASANYAWDGATGALLQTEDLMVPSLIHDIGCQAINLGLLPHEYRPMFDREYLLQCEAYKVWPWRRQMHYLAIRMWGLIPKKEESVAKYARVYFFKVLE